MNAPDLTTTFCGITLPNPLVLASGILGVSAALMARVAAGGAGAVTAKSCSRAPRPGHPNPTVLAWGAGFINAVGLANPGVDEEIAVLQETRRRLAQAGQGVKLVASIFGTAVEDYAYLAERMNEARPDFLEINISCPNVHDELARPFAASCPAAAAVTRAVKRVSAAPVIVKLSPNVTDIYQCYQAVKIPILGIGGVSCGEDAAELLLAGATLVGVGSAVHSRGIAALGQIRDELAQFMLAEGCGRAAELVGLAHWPAGMAGS